MLPVPMDDATHVTDQTVDTAPASSGDGFDSRRCLCCTTPDTPIVTLATACVHYLRCSACGFIWTIRAPDAAAIELTSTESVEPCVSGK